MSRIAIVIGVSEYTRQQPLPACKNDADIVKFVLDKSSAYEDILFLTEAAAHSDESKYLLAQFVEKHKGRSDIEEVFFFYSGHGAFIDNEFYYLFSDFEDSRRNRTSLKNSELDGYLRTLNPDVAVKIVDACNAGIQYVKNASNLSEVIEKRLREQGLKKVYFLFSSLLDQSSFASSEISDYTRSLIESIFTSRRPEIRYRDIVDHVADRFCGNVDQRPFFVIQADNTELFGVFEDNEKIEIKGRLDLILNRSDLETAKPIKRPTLADLIKEQAKDYLSDDEIISAISNLQGMANKFYLPSDVRELFKINVEATKSLHGLNGVAEIGKWLQGNGGEFFGRVITRIEEYEGYENKLVEALASFGQNGVQKIKQKREVVSGYEPSWDALPFWRIGVVLNAGYPNVPMFRLNIVYLFSQLDIRIFYNVESKSAAPGDAESRAEFGPWKALQVRLRQLNDDPNCIGPLFENFTDQVVAKLRQIAGISEDSSAELDDGTVGSDAQS